MFSLYTRENTFAQKVRFEKSNARTLKTERPEVKSWKTESTISIIIPLGQTLSVCLHHALTLIYPPCIL
ncbi:hypothetical protein FQR65_LT03278 [Abscondita terminalis]|nr:hypothetical protein FQR65_LT03278 [Abscondita terminalis]